MLKLVVYRLLWAIPLLLIVSVLTFVLLGLVPGDPARAILGPYATDDQLDALRTSLGLDQPWYAQYWSWLSHAVTGDLGTSISTKTSVSDLLIARLPSTLSLAVVTTLASATLGITLGVFSAVRGGWAGRVTDAFAMLGVAIPNYWLGIVLVGLFAVQLGWFPATGFTPITDGFGPWARSLVLPVTTLCIGGIPMIAKNTRDSMREVLARDFIDCLRASGWSDRRIVLGPALRNAAIPVVTAVGIFFSGVLGGAVLIEMVFALPGLGRLAVSSTSSHDIPVLLGVTVYFCIGVVLINLLVDIAYGWLNPKARLS